MLIPVICINSMDSTVREHEDEVAIRVIEAVATNDGVDPLELEPLYDVVDPDALDTICRTDLDLKVQFEYCGHVIEVRSDGRIAVDDEMYRY